MDARDELLTIAEIAIGIAGFSGVVAAFLQRDGLHPLDRVRFLNIFATAFITLVLAFVPIAISQVVTEPDRIWSYSSAALIVISVSNSIVAFVWFVPVVRAHLESQANIPLAMLVVPTCFSLVVQFLNSGGWVWEPGFLAYLFGLFVYIYAAGLMFVYAVLFRPEDSSDT
ncbi:MAG: hypothetical protein GY937_25235 [bacterium]|nr:hypothetical protein [bacterium]